MEEPTETNENAAIDGDLPLDLDTIRLIPCPYTDIITEFADVEIFLISLDSLLLELCAHRYHKWVLGGQTIVLCEQIKQFLGGLEELNAKFKLVTFTELTPLFKSDTFLAFLHPFILCWITKSKWAENLEFFTSPLDEKWNDYLHQLTPSFMLLSLENAPDIIKEPINFADRFISLAFSLINEAIPVVLFNGFTINFISVNAYRLSTVPLNIEGFSQKIREKWPETRGLAYQTQNSDLVSCQNITDFWAVVLRDELKEAEKNKEKLDEFQKFCNAVLLSALICEELGVKRRYLDTEEDYNKGPSPSVNSFRRGLLERAQKLLSGAVEKQILFSLDDIWDGRMVFTCFKKIMSGEKILPLRRQEKFAQLHKSVGLTVAIPTDLEDKLLDPISPQNFEQQSTTGQCIFYKVENELLRQFIPDFLENSNSLNCCTSFPIDFSKLARNQLGWKFSSIDDPLLIKEEAQREWEKVQMADPKKANRLLHKRQDLSKWYQLFSDSLEGQMLVDFTRVPKANVSETKETTVQKETVKKEKDAGVKKKAGKPGAGGGKGGSQLSKKDQILKESREKKNKEQIESDRQKIEYATGIKANAIFALDDLLRRLELDESKALCMYQKMLRYNEIFSERLENFENIDNKRIAALELVESIKVILTKYYDHLDSQQKDKIQTLWLSLGFGVADSSKRRADKAYNLDIDLVYYQLQYGGRMLEILSDPKKDERVTGFLPDAWQRKMLDAVDQDKSALIVAPTSAGKTFISYYCIEKVLRKSNDEVVVYICPSKALTNQYVGSVYARFRSKNMSGGKVLYGIYTNEILNNPLNCQVLVTNPDCFEQILLSTSERCREFVSRIRYVILDEVHCINQKDTQGLSLGHIWEHIFLLIRCPFLALSATIGNIEELRDWLQEAEQLKPIDGAPARTVELITYDERWSELEIALHKIRECPKGVQFETDETKFFRGSSVTSNEIEDGTGEDATNDRASVASRASNNNSPVPSEISQQSKATWNDVVQFFNPFSVYKLEKLRMFGIPADQRLTARQVLELYQMMSDVDKTVRDEFEPRRFFKTFFTGNSAADPMWLNRGHLRHFETALKERFVHWMQEDKSKIGRIFTRLESEVQNEFEKRSKMNNMRNSALFNIMRLIDQLKEKQQIPALCFNDDREICEHLAIRVFNELQTREENYKTSAVFQRRYNFKAEEKAQKLAKRKRDEEERAAKRKTKRTDEEGNVERHEKKDETAGTDTDQFALLRIRMRDDLGRFKLHGNWTDEDIYNRVVERLRKTYARDPAKKSTEMLLKLFERGIGFHHDGLSNQERSSVEALFRRGFLGVVFSTSTLALGMNLPCKTVIFGIDTPKLTPLQFRQMSGRAGRRGYDPAGTVIFMSLPTSKIRRLLTASLATLRGNAPFTAAFLLRLFAYANSDAVGKREKSETSDPNTEKSKAILGKKQQLVDTNDVRSEVVRRKAALTLLKAPFVLKTKHKNIQTPEEQSSDDTLVFMRILKSLTFFNVQLLRRLQMLDEKCFLHGFAQFALHLSQREPGNLLFVSLLQEGIFHRYFAKHGDLFHHDNLSRAKDDWICILAHIFTAKILPFYVNLQGTNESMPVLPPLDESIEAHIEKHNREVNELLLACLQFASNDRRLENPVFALGGLSAECLSRSQIDFVPAFKSEFILDECLFPLTHLSRKDHRGVKIHYNSYAYDFWKNPDVDALGTRNKLTKGEQWYLINDFNKMLTEISSGLDYIAQSKDSLCKVAKEVADEFDVKFREAFKMKRRKEKEDKEKEGVKEEEAGTQPTVQEKPKE